MRPAPSSSAASWSTSRRPASTPATAPASCRRSSVTERHLATIRDYTRRIARALKVVGLMNVQFAIKDDTVYVLEVNPRASRTVPYLSKATGVPLAKIAARVMAGRTLARARADRGPRGRRRLREEPGVPVRPVPRRRHDPRARDEVHRRGDGRRRQLRRRRSPRRSSAPAQRLPEGGTAFISVNNDDKPTVRADRARPGASSGSSLMATRGTAAYLRAHGLDVEVVFKVNEGRPNVGDEIVNRKIAARHQHAARPRVVLRRPHRPPRRDDARRAVHHHADRRRRRGQRDPRAPDRGAERAGAAGLPRRNCDGSCLSAAQFLRAGSLAIVAIRVRNRAPGWTPGPRPLLAASGRVCVPAAIVALPLLAGALTGLVISDHTATALSIYSASGAVLALLSAVGAFSGRVEPRCCRRDRDRLPAGGALAGRDVGVSRLPSTAPSVVRGASLREIRPRRF